MLVTSLYVNVNKTWVIFAACLLAYWNAHFFLVYGLLCSSWVLFNTYVYCASQVVAHVFMKFGALPSTCSADAFERETEYGRMLASTIIHVLYARSAMRYWSAAMASSVALGVWRSCLGVWVRRWNHCTRFQKLRTMLWCVILMCCYVLQWAYYATLPTATTASRDSLARLHSTQVTLQQGDMFMWYTSTVGAAVNAIQVFVLLLTCFQHSFGYFLLTRWLSKTGCTTHAFEDTWMDPNSVEFDLASLYVCAFFTTLLAWLYSPRGVPLVVQVLVLISIFTTLARRGNLRAYQRILMQLPDVHASVEQACGICLDDFAQGEQAKRLPCGHFFHGRCVRRWLHTHNDCPMCRQPVDTPVGLPLYSELLPHHGTMSSLAMLQNLGYLSSEEVGVTRSAQSPFQQLPQHELPVSVAAMPATEAANTYLRTASCPLGPSLNVPAALEDVVREVELRLSLATQRRQEVSQLCQTLCCISNTPFRNYECDKESELDLAGDDGLFQDEPLRLKQLYQSPGRKRARSSTNYSSPSEEELRKPQRRNTRDPPN